MKEFEIIQNNKIIWSGAAMDSQHAVEQYMQCCEINEISHN